jgi:hypothetical protein
VINTIVLSGRISKAIRSNSVNGSDVVNFVGAFETGLMPKLATVDGKEMLVQVPVTTYIDCAAWNADADHAASLEIGQEVSVQLTSLFAKPREYDGKLYADMQARVTNVRPGAKSKGKTLGNGAPAASSATSTQDDEIPF